MINYLVIQYQCLIVAWWNDAWWKVTKPSFATVRTRSIKSLNFLWLKNLFHVTRVYISWQILFCLHLKRM